MSECMMFPENWEEFIKDYSFKDSEEVYTNGTVLVPVFRVEQMVEHYFNNVWIPVSERLPEREKVVLVCGSRGGIYTAFYKGSRYWHKLNSRSHFCEPTHWMPLPEPPKEK